MFRFFPMMLVGAMLAGVNFVIDTVSAVANTLLSALGESQSISLAHVSDAAVDWTAPIGVIIIGSSLVAGFWNAAIHPHGRYAGPSIAAEEQKPVQLEKKAEPKTIAPAISQPTISKWDEYRDGLLAKQKKAVSEIELLANSMHADANKFNDEDAYDYDQIVNHHLPTSLDLYKKALQRRGDKSEAIELINSQLDNMKSGLETIYSHINEGMLHEMRIQSSFLDTKYAKKVKATALKSK